MVRRLLLILAAILGVVASSANAAPARVVSINVCTDQLAMMLEAPGQLVAVSHLARDPAYSALSEQAQDYPVTHGLAEEIFLMQPDLVLAGSFSTRATVEMLRRLGLPVIEFPMATSFEGIRKNIRQMGRALGREAEAEAMIDEFDANLDAARREKGANPPRAALHYANSYTSGIGTLVDEIVSTAGLANIAAERGVAGYARLPLEVLITAEPDLVIGPQSYATPALAQANAEHPAYRALAGRVRQSLVADATTVCGGPFTIEAVKKLATARDQLKDE